MNKKLFLLSFFILPSVVFGADYQGTIYTWGYGDLIKNMLEGIRALVDNNGLATIFKVAMGVAFLLFTFQKAVNDRLNPAIELGKMMLLFTAIWYLFLTAPNDAQHRYLIQDRVTGDTYVVEQVPTGIGEPLSLISTLEDKILEKIEVYFSLPDSLTYRNSGFGFPLRTHDTASTTSTGNIYLIRTLNDFIENCTMYEISEGSKNVKDLIYSNDLLSALDPNGDTRLTKYYSSSNPDGVVKSCKDVYPLLRNDIVNDTLVLEKVVANLLNTNQVTFQQRANYIVPLLFKNTWDGRRYLQQLYLINLTKKSILNVAKANGISPNEVAYASAIAQENFKNNLLVSGKMARDYLPIVKGVLVAVIVGLSWIIALLSVAFNNFSYIRLYFMLLFWLMMWSPILAIINYIGDTYLSKIFSSITENTGQVITIYTAPYIDEKISNALGWLGYLVWLVPLLAYSIVKASEHGFVMFANSLSQMTSSASSVGAGKQTQESLSHTSHRRVGATTYTDMTGGGLMSNRQFAYAGSVVDEHQVTANGQTIYQANLDNGSAVGAFSEGGMKTLQLSGVTLSGINNLQATSQQAYQSAHKQVTSLENVLSKSVSNAVDETLRSNHIINHSFGKNLSVGDRKELASAEANAFREVFSHDEKASKFARKMHEAVGNMGAGLNIKVVKGEVEYSFRGVDGKEHTYTDSTSNALENAKRFESRFAKSIAENETLSKSYAEQISGGRGETYRELFSNMESYKQALSQERSALQSWNMSKAVSETLTSNKAILLGTALMKDYMKQGLDVESAGLKAMKKIEDMANSGDVNGLYRLMEKYSLVDNNLQQANNLKDVSDGMLGYEAVKNSTSIINNTDLPNQKNHHLNLSKVNKDMPTEENLKDKFNSIDVSNNIDNSFKNKVTNAINSSEVKDKSALEIGIKEVTAELENLNNEYNNLLFNAGLNGGSSPVFRENASKWIYPNNTKTLQDTRYNDLPSYKEANRELEGNKSWQQTNKKISDLIPNSSKDK